MISDLNPVNPAPAAQAGSALVESRRIVAQLRNSDIFRKYRQAFEAATGLPLVLRRPGSFQAPLHDSKLRNPFCTLMASAKQSCAACLQLQHGLETEVASGARTLECFAGLRESVVPIRVGENIIGYLQTGQIFFRPASGPRFRRLTGQLRQWGRPMVDQRRLKAAYFQTRVIPRTRYEAILGLLATFALHLESCANQILISTTLIEDPVIAKARAFIATRQAETLSLGAVARAVNMSAYYFCKIFKRTTGLTFGEYLARARTETVKQMLLDPHRRVSEAAFAAGFQSLSQFNRVFRRIMGESPTTFRAKFCQRINTVSRACLTSVRVAA